MIISSWIYNENETSSFQIEDYYAFLFIFKRENIFQVSRRHLKLNRYIMLTMFIFRCEFFLIFVDENDDDDVYHLNEMM